MRTTKAKAPHLRSPRLLSPPFTQRPLETPQTEPMDVARPLFAHSQHMEATISALRTQLAALELAHQQQMQQTQQWQQQQQHQAAQIAQQVAQTTIAQASHELQTAVSHAQHTTEQQNVQTQQLWQHVQAELPRMVSAAIYQAQQTQPSSSSSAPHAAQPVYHIAGPSQDIPDAHDIVEPEEADGKKPRLPFYDGTHDPEL